MTVDEIALASHFKVSLLPANAPFGIKTGKALIVVTALSVSV